MKKSNIIILALLTAVSIFLLWLWYYLEFNFIDHPLDLVLSILWWIVMVVAIIVIIKIEKRRKEQIRTIYVSDTEIFNSEKGKMEVAELTDLVNNIEEMLKNLKYDFTESEKPDREMFSVRYIIKTLTFKDDTWEGKVVDALTEGVVSFGSREELTRILSGEKMVKASPA